MTDDHHKRHALRQRLRVVEQSTVPADLALEVPPVPAWMQPTPRRSKYSGTPLIQYQRKHNLIRHLCALVPRLKPVARLIF